MINFNPNEIFGMAILEAMYHNVTIVARHAPGPDCIIENGRSGFLCNSVEEIAQTILSGKKVQNARKRIIEYFTWESTAKKFWIIYNTKTTNICVYSTLSLILI